MRRLLLPVLLLLLLVQGTNFRGWPGRIEPVRGDSSASSTDSILRYWLRTQSVSSSPPFPKTYWFWISESELDTIRQQQALLWTHQSSGSSATLYEMLLEQEVFNDNPYAKMLRGSEFSRKKGAWPCYWSTIIPGADTSGAVRNQLVKVVLEDSSYIVLLRDFSDQDRGLSVYDMKGNLVSLPEVEKHSNRIAGVFLTGNVFCFRDKNPPFSRRRKNPAPFRYFVLVNESMIKSWHHGVPGMQDQLAKDMNYLMLLHAWSAEYPARAFVKPVHAVPPEWISVNGRMPMSSYYFSTRCDVSMDGESIEASTHDVIEHIRAAWKAQGKPVEKFPSRGIR
jgi:hypothetical protein